MILPVICLMGPTASGKTDLALKLFETFPIEIISVDSAQIYRGMDIGAGKITLQQQQQVPHHLLDILDPKSAYSAAQFCADALRLIKEIKQRQKIPLLVGGTMMYFKALQEGLSPVPASCPKVRATLNNAAVESGLAPLFARLTQVDPLTAQKIKANDTQRIVRALEVFDLTAKPFSSWLQMPGTPPACDFMNIALLPIETPRSVLHTRIEQRFDHMLAQGLIAEVNTLFERGDLDLSLPALKAVGYRQAWQYLQKQISYDQMREQAIAATRQLAKRQLTWLRHWSKITFFDFNDQHLLKKVSAELSI